jgi:riboflavin synthase
LDDCFVVRDQNGQQLAYVYFEDEPGRRSVAKLLTKDEARRIAANIAKLTQAARATSRAGGGGRREFITSLSMR